MNDVIQKIYDIGIVPVIAIDDADKAVPLAKALVKGGLPAAEVTFRTAAAEEAIKRIVAEVPEMLVGAGTVLTKEQADRAIAAGVKFIVSPGFNPEITKYVIDKGMLMMPGTATPGEMEQAMSMGLDVVKFFPAEQNGGVAKLKAVAGPYTNLRWMPTGGVNAKNLLDYLSFNKIIACGGTWMVKKDLIEAENWDEIERLTREAVNTIRTQSLRVREITRKLLMVGHGLDARTGPLDVAAIIDEVIDLLRHRFDATGLQCLVDLSGACLPEEQRMADDLAVEDALRPWGSAPELRQIFLHLFENALDAMPHGGVVRVTAKVRRDGQSRSWYDLLVADTGPGIAPDIMPHIFEPFFSSRALQSGCGSHDQYHDSHSGSAMRPGSAAQSHMGRYAGLGLAVARSLAHARGGELSAANSQEGGAVFCLSLPLAQMPPAAGQAVGDRSPGGGL